ncbi:MAG: SLBB domain-containing protein [Deltaproteobacteria bacterium]|nr:SLBB domain-containing protein [Deltaproteobacteria bacterium]
MILALTIGVLFGAASPSAQAATAAGAAIAQPLPGPALAQAAPASPSALPPGVTPQQLDAAKQAIQSGAPLSPETQKLLESRPDLKNQLPEEIRKKLEEQEAEKGKPPAKPEGAKTPEQAGTLPPYDWRTSVYVGGLFSKRLREAEIRTMSHFGHELFSPKPGGFAVLENMPVAPDYVIGPGDEIVVKMWGRMEGTQRMTVDRDGKIFFPKIGSLYVAGKTFSELKGFLKGKVSNIAEVSSDVTMGQMKGIRVSVIGEVRMPGWYNVSSLHTALQALFLAGGVKDIGSLRRIELRRNGRAVETIDLYDFLLRGETRSDTTLLQGDSVFVPVVGKLVAITGEVRRPAIYELKDEKSLADLVKMAGGFAPSAYKKRVQVERLEGHIAKIVLDTDAEELEKEKKEFDLSDGDIVRVLPIVFADVNAVTLEGNVVRPGKYELKPGMTISALLPDINAFLPETYFDYALLTRLVPPDMRKEVIPVSLREIVLEKKKEADIPLKARDTLTVFPRSAFRDAPRATISGEVRLIAARVKAFSTDNQALARTYAADNQAAASRPGFDPFADNNALSFELKAGMRVADLVKLAGGLTRLAYLERAEIIRVDDNRNFRTIYFNLGKAVGGDPKENVHLENEDQVRIHSIWETRYKKIVTAAGEVNAPGDYILTEGMKLSDLLFKAGGFKESAYVREAELVRREIAPGGELVKTDTITVYPERVLSGDANYDVALREYDLLVIRTIPDWAEKIQVTLAGEVRFPGTYTARKGERLSSVVARAGGFTKDAYFKAAQFTRVSTQKTQQEAIDRLISDLEMEIAQRAQMIGGSLDKEDVEANKEQMAARRGVLDQLRKVRAKGRVVIHLAALEKLKGSSDDILLEDGDRLEVPRRMNVVNVVGRVYNPTGVVFDPAKDTVGHYLRTVGGPMESADREHIFVLKANGSVVSRESAESGFFVFGEKGLMSAKVEPGDSIVVPEKLVQTRLMKDVKDITQILYQIAVTAGVLIVVF